jgi:hypothetical protein
MPNAKHIAIRASKDLTRWIGLRWGEKFPFYYVAEHPKSGGTWLSKMVADYLQLPFPQHSIFPIGAAAVIQNMWLYDRRFRRVFYIYRDGRDVITSYFFDRIRVARHSNYPGRKRLDRIYQDLLGKNYDPNDSVKLMPIFMEHEFKHPGRGTPVNWRDHVMSWCETRRDNVAYLSYEELLADCAGTLGRAIRHASGQDIDEWRLKATIEKFSMERQTGRKRGEADHTQHMRKGVAGDWLNHFSRDTAQLFNDLMGDALVMLGYEKDRNWIDKYKYRPD